MENFAEYVLYLKIGGLVTAKYVLYGLLVHKMLFNIQATNMLMHSLKLEQDEKE